MECPLGFYEINADSETATAEDAGGTGGIGEETDSRGASAASISGASRPLSTA